MFDQGAGFQSRESDLAEGAQWPRVPAALDEARTGRTHYYSEGSADRLEHLEAQVSGQ